MYTIHFDLPNLAKGEELSIDGLGTFENGRTYDISAEDAEQFRMRNMSQLNSSHDKDGFLVYETDLGPTLLQAFKNHPNITVETSKPVDTKSGTNSNPTVSTATPATLNGPTEGDTNSVTREGRV